jgi:hypothetical protein
VEATRVPQQPDEEQEDNGRAPWVPKNVPELLALAGALAFGVTYLGCVLFYAPLGVEPSDVGLGYAEVLAQAAVFIAILLLPPVLNFILLNKGKAPIRLATVAAAVVLLGVYMSVTALIGKDDVQAGDNPFDIVGLLPWSDTHVAHVQWTTRPSADADPPPELPGCVIRLGEADSTEVFYDPTSESALRLPQSIVVVRVLPHADGCPVPAEPG